MLQSPGSSSRGTDAGAPLSEEELQAVIQRWERGDHLSAAEAHAVRMHFQSNRNDYLQQRRGLRAKRQRARETEPEARKDWTPALRRAVEEEKKLLGIESTIYDVPLATKVLTRATRWRELVFQELILLVVFSLVICYVFLSPSLSTGTWAAEAVMRDMAGRPFVVPRTVLDDPGASGNFTAESTVDLDPVTLTPVPKSVAAWRRCSGIPGTTSDTQASACLDYGLPRLFSQIRSINDYEAWVANVLGQSQILTGKGPLVMLGAARVFQTSVTSCNTAQAFKANSIPQNGNTVACVPIYNGANINSSMLFARQAGIYQTAAQLAQFPDPIQPNVNYSYTFENLQQSSTFLNLLYPSSGYALDLPRGNVSLALQAWNELVALNWLTSSTMLTSLSFTAWDPSGNILVFASFSLQIYSTSTVVPVSDVRAFYVPGTFNVEFALRWTLTIFTLTLLVLTLMFVFYRLWNKAKLETVFTWGLLLDVSTLCVIQGAMWVIISMQLGAGDILLSLPHVFAALAQSNYTSYVPAYDSISYVVKLSELLLGISILIMGLNIYRLLTLYPMIALPYTIVAFSAYEIFRWCITALFTLIFFGLGGYYMFGFNTAEFSTIGNSILTSIIYSSHVIVPFDTIQGQLLEYSYTGRPSSDLVIQTFPYQQAVIFTFVLWMAVLIVFFSWILRNVLLGIVIDAYERVLIESEAIRVERREREIAFENAGLKQRWYRFLRRAWHHSSLKRLHERLATDVRLNLRGFATEQEMQSAVVDAAGEGAAPELMHLLSVFRIQLKRLDDAIALVLLQDGHMDFEDDDLQVEGSEDLQRTGRIVDNDSAVLTALSFVIGLKDSASGLELGEGVAGLDRVQRLVQKKLSQATPAPNPWVDNRGKHGIEKMPDATYRVHLMTPAGSYRFVGEYSTIVDAEAAFALASNVTSVNTDRSAREEVGKSSRRVTKAAAVVDRPEDEDDDDAVSLPMDTAGDVAVARRRGQGVRDWFADVGKTLLRFFMGSSRVPREVLYMDARGRWCDVHGVDAAVRQPVSVLPLSKLRWEKKNGKQGGGGGGGGGDDGAAGVF